MIRDQVFARLREEALFSRTCSVFQLFFAGRKAEVRRRAAHIVDVSLKIRFLCQVFRLIDDRFVASYLNNTPLMERQRTEAAAAEAATVADQAEFHLRERRDPACRIVGRMPPPHIRKCVDIIHLLNRKRFCRWVLDNIKVVPVLLHKTFSREGIRIFILDIEAFRITSLICFDLIIGRQGNRIVYGIQTVRLIDSSVDKCDILHIKTGVQRVRDLNDRLLAHSVGDQVCLGIHKNRVLHLVRPVIIVGQAP